MNIETKNFILDWLAKANEDLLVINKLTEGDIIAPSAIEIKQLTENKIYDIIL